VFLARRYEARRALEQEQARERREARVSPPLTNTFELETCGVLVNGAVLHCPLCSKTYEHRDVMEGHVTSKKHRNYLELEVSRLLSLKTLREGVEAFDKETGERVYTLADLPHYVTAIPGGGVQLSCTLCSRQFYDVEGAMVHFQSNQHVKKVEWLEVRDYGVRGRWAVEAGRPTEPPSRARRMTYTEADLAVAWSWPPKVEAEMLNSRFTFRPRAVVQAEVEDSDDEYPEFIVFLDERAGRVKCTLCNLNMTLDDVDGHLDNAHR
jgi:hypothetical protein